MIIANISFLQLFLSICFIHPSCYQDSPPSGLLSDGDIDLEAASPLARDVARSLLERRTEKARNLIISALMETQDKVKFLMFKYMETGVGARGVSVLATRKIIDSLKVNKFSHSLSHNVTELSVRLERVCF